MPIFEKASRLKIRFDYRGLCTTEDLWDISLSSLDDMFKELSRLNQDEESLLAKEDNSDNAPTAKIVLTTKIEIIRHIVGIRLDERTEAENEKTRADRKQQLLAIIADKQDDKLRSMSAKELTKLIDEL